MLCLSFYSGRIYKVENPRYGYEHVLMMKRTLCLKENNLGPGETGVLKVRYLLVFY